MDQKIWVTPRHAFCWLDEDNTIVVSTDRVRKEGHCELLNTVSLILTVPFFGRIYTYTYTVFQFRPKLSRKYNALILRKKASQTVHYKGHYYNIHFTFLYTLYFRTMKNTRRLMWVIDLSPQPQKCKSMFVNLSFRKLSDLLAHL